MSRIASWLTDFRPRIAVVLTRAEQLVKVPALARLGASLIELRVDCDAAAGVEKWLRPLRKRPKLPVLITIRRKSEGGFWPHDDRLRLEWYKRLLPYADALDVELNSPGLLKSIRPLAKRMRKVLVISRHDFKRTPSMPSLRSFARRGSRSGADVLKIAAVVRNDTDRKRLTDFLCEYPARPIIVLGMGAKARSTRILFALIGSLWTYAHTGRATAPGQMSLKETVRRLKRAHYEMP